MKFKVKKKKYNSGSKSEPFERYMGPPAKDKPAIDRVVEVPIDSVSLWVDNPRKNDKSVRPLAKLLKQYGQRTPIVVWVEDNCIYKGNTTWKAAKYLKWDKIWVAYANFRDHEDAVSYGLADNKSSEWSEWDDNILTKLLTEKFKGLDKAQVSGLTGFKESELSSFLLSTKEMPDELPIVDIKGNVVSLKDDYAVLEFDNKSQRLKFMEAIDVSHDRNRLINIEQLLEFMSEEIQEAMNTPKKLKKKKVLKRRRM